ncbi:UNVERIFIED_CONTAM: hypothetical protein RMT77_016243 [Armadillidium vulgare]
MIFSALKDIYSKIYCLSSSTNETLLSVGNSDGKLIIFDIKELMPQKGIVGREKLNKPVLTISAHNDPIYSMASSKEFCITGATGVISGWKWKDLRRELSKTAWNINLECDQSNFGTPEVNSLAYDSERNWVFAACGDWRTRAFDLETGKETLSLSGHEDYVHDVVVSGNQVYSAGEDGQVLVWDPRVGREPKIKLKPYTNEQIQRPQFGKYITSVDVENDWLICGGGPQAGIFHLRSLALTTVFEPKETSIHVTKFTRQGFDRGSIVVAGASSQVNVCNISGEITAKILASSSCVYDVHVLEHPNTIAFIGGTGVKLDVCPNLNYRDHTVSVSE